VGDRGCGEEKEKESEMRRVFLTAAIACLLASNAWAGVTCQQIGQFTYCSDSQGNRTTCQQIGNQTYCN
jgi:hypothetical protein